MAIETIKVPDLGGAQSVEVIEINIAAGDEVAEEDTLLVLESDKATMDIPSPAKGVVKKILVKLGDAVSQGSDIVELEVVASEVDGADLAQPEAAATDDVASTGKEAPQEQGATQSDAGVRQAKSGREHSSLPTPSAEQVIQLPDLGTDEAVEVIDIAVSVGDEISQGDTLMTLEGDKAAMDVPSPHEGTILKLLVAQGSKVSSGADIAVIQPASAPAAASVEAIPANEKPSQERTQELPQELTSQVVLDASGVDESASLPGTTETVLREEEAPATEVYAGPLVRQLARELGVDLRNVNGSGLRGRIQREDVKAYVKLALETLESHRGASQAPHGGAIPAIADVDFSRFGDIEEVPLSKTAKLTAANMHRAWLNVPAVTQFDKADITDMEQFRGSLKAEAEKRGVRITPMAFLMVACANLLRDHPVINRSWHSSGEKVIQKHYVHIGMAVDTPRGLLVPVLRDVDRKGLFELAEEIATLAEKARAGKLSAGEMQGGSFSISSLGAVGGQGFTPIVNSPEAAILGVSKATIEPVWNGNEFLPRQMLPLSLSYDHRLINGASAGKFLTELVGALGDIRKLLL